MRVECKSSLSSSYDPKVMRTYQQAWETLKAQERITLSSPKIYHSRIIKAIQKEKHLDLGFKMLCDECSHYAIVYTVESVENKLSLVLRYFKGKHGKSIKKSSF